MKKNLLLEKNIETFDVNFRELTPIMFSEAFDYLIDKFEKEFKETIKLINPTYKDLFCSETYDRLIGVFHLMGSMNTLIENEELRKVEEKYSAIFSIKATEWSLNKDMFDKTVEFTKTEEYSELSDLRKKMIQKNIKDLKEGGIDLPLKQKKKLAKLNEKLSVLSQKFQNNITDAQENLSFVVGKSALKGLSSRSLKNIEELSKEMEMSDGKYYIDEPSGLISDIMQNSKNEKIRKKIYLRRRALCTNGKYDNSKLIHKIYILKQEIAEILGYKNYAVMSLEDEMAKEPEKALEFLDNLGAIALPYAKEESKRFLDFGKNILNKNVDWWDYEYIENQILKSDYKIDQEELRLFFPANKVIDGLFTLCKELFDVSFKENKEKNTWHEDVKYFDVFEGEKHIGGIFMDLFKRSGKTPGAWLDPICSYEDNNLRKTKPIALLVCNVAKDIGQVPTFELEEIVTLFHEMGHGLHHLLSKVEEEFFSGFNNVQHDAVEIPSQLMENFVYDAKVLKQLSEHIKTKEIITDELIEKINKSRKFLGSNMIVKMVRYSEMDMKLYMQKDLHPYEIEMESIEKWKISDHQDPSHRRMDVFSHIFGGGYAAGYYAYQWAEVYAADGYNYIVSGSDQERLDRIKKYKEEILYTGGKRSMKENYELFKPSEVDLNHLINNYLEKV